MSLEKKIEQCEPCEGKGYEISTDTENLTFTQMVEKYKSGCENCGGSGRESTILIDSNEPLIYGSGKVKNFYENGKLVKTKPYKNYLVDVGIYLVIGGGLLYYFTN